MLAQFPIHLSLSHWELVAVPLAGLTFAGLTLLMGRSWLRARRKENGPPPPPDKESQPRPDPFDYGSAMERRASLRRAGKVKKVLISDAEATATPKEGWVVDRSMGGLGLSVREPVNSETILSVRTIDAPANTPWVQVKVIHCIADEDRWELGCQYLRVPSWSIVLLFG